MFDITVAQLSLGPVTSFINSHYVSHTSYTIIATHAKSVDPYGTFQFKSCMHDSEGLYCLLNLKCMSIAILIEDYDTVHYYNSNNTLDLSLL